MWYVIQVKSGEEDKIKLMLEERLKKEYYAQCFIPLCETVRRRQDKSTIFIRRLFPGYIFIDTENPVEVHKALNAIPDFAAILGIQEDKGSQKTYMPVGNDDVEFLNTLLKDGIMHVSYVHLARNNKIDRVIGPLERYKKYITKMEYRHRFATVEASIFGKRRKIHFGLWGDSDSKIPWIEERKKGIGNGENINKAVNRVAVETGIVPGDIVEYPEVYGDRTFVVDKVDIYKGIIYTSIEMFGSLRKIEMYLEDVRKVGMEAT